jgi:hypothetical protein
MYSSISLGLLPAGWMRAGEPISVGKRRLLLDQVNKERGSRRKEIGLAEQSPRRVY